MDLEFKIYHKKLFLMKLVNKTLTILSDFKMLSNENITICLQQKIVFFSLVGL